MSKPTTLIFEQHPFHLVRPSPWPFLVSQLLFLLLVTYTFTVMHNDWYVNTNLYNTALYFFTCKYFINKVVALYLPFFVQCLFAKLFWVGLFGTYIYSWFADIITESVYEGNHTEKVQIGLRYGMVLFILSEVMFFFSFFWAFFHSSTITPITTSGTWVPFGIVAISPWHLPFFNTCILLFSGITVTWAHHAFISENYSAAIKGLFSTILLGIIFTFLQWFEYKHTEFTVSTGVYGSIFFVATGFHGLHVLIGTLFLAICLHRLRNYQFTSQQHFGFEAAAWYWHFVDVVWLFLFIMVYWWSF